MILLPVEAAYSRTISGVPMQGVKDVAITSALSPGGNGRNRRQAEAPEA